MKIKNYFKPQELVFTTDDVVCDGIGQAVQKYEKVVSLALMECTAMAMLSKYLLNQLLLLSKTDIAHCHYHRHWVTASFFFFFFFFLGGGGGVCSLYSQQHNVWLVNVAFGHDRHVIIANCFFQAALINLMVYHPDEYGKGSIKPLKIHPDTFVQMAIQLAYYKLHGKYVQYQVK